MHLPGQGLTRDRLFPSTLDLLPHAVTQKDAQTR